MAKVYHSALASLSTEGQKETKDYQRQWLKERTSDCEAVIRGDVIYHKTHECYQKCYDTFEDFIKKNKDYDVDDCKKKCLAPFFNLKLNYADDHIVGPFTECLKRTYTSRIDDLLNILVKFPDHTFRNVHIDHSKTDKTCDEDYISASPDIAYTFKELTYPQIENPKSDNEKLWNSVVSKKITDKFKNEENEECTDINDTYRVYFINKHLISIQGELQSHDHGEQHPPTIITSFAWLLENKRELKAKDLFDDKTNWKNKLVELASQELENMKSSKKDTTYKATPSYLITVVTSPERWVITGDGLVIQFQRFDFRRLVVPFSITIDWKILDSYLSKKGHSLISE